MSSASHRVGRRSGHRRGDHPALWRQMRRFNLPVKLALAAAHASRRWRAPRPRRGSCRSSPCRPARPSCGAPRTRSRQPRRHREGGARARQSDLHAARDRQPGAVVAVDRPREPRAVPRSGRRGRAGLEALDVRSSTGGRQRDLAVRRRSIGDGDRGAGRRRAVSRRPLADGKAMRLVGVERAPRRRFPAGPPRPTRRAGSRRWLGRCRPSRTSAALLRRAGRRRRRQRSDHLVAEVAMTAPSNQRVVVTGCGALSPFGVTAAELVGGVVAGRSLRRVPRAVPAVAGHDGRRGRACRSTPRTRAS